MARWCSRQVPHQNFPLRRTKIASLIEIAGCVGARIYPTPTKNSLTAPGTSTIQAGLLISFNYKVMTMEPISLKYNVGIFYSR